VLRRRYLLGWVALLALAVTASAGTLVLVRVVIGGGPLVNALSQGEVRARYAAALEPVRATTSSASSSATVSAAPSSAGSTHTSASPSAPQRHGSPAATTHQGGSSTGSGSGPQGGSTSSTPGHPTQPPPPASTTKLLTSPGGSVVARCQGSGGSATVYLVSWSPAQGYSVNDVQRGPGHEAQIEFESGSQSVSVQFHCSASGPVQQVETDGGGGDDGGEWSDG
jgi:hypothetical protein